MRHYGNQLDLFQSYKCILNMNLSREIEIERMTHSHSFTQIGEMGSLLQFLEMSENLNLDIIMISCGDNSLLSAHLA